MIFVDAPIADAFVIEPEWHVDDRGAFARTWCAREFAEHGIEMAVVQSSLSTNRRKGTLRGMHYSVAPYPEAKVVRCTRGAIYDVLLDLRTSSPSYLRWFGKILTADEGLALYVPEGVAHGFQTLADSSDVLYQMSEVFDANCARGVRWDDPYFGIEWPGGPRILSERDSTYADFEPRGA